MTGRQLAILAELQRHPDGRTAAQLRDAVSPGTSISNITVQIFYLRERHSDDVTIESRQGATGYRLRRLSEVAATLIKAGWHERPRAGRRDTPATTNGAPA